MKAVILFISFSILIGCEDNQAYHASSVTTNNPQIQAWCYTMESYKACLEQHNDPESAKSSCAQIGDDFNETSTGKLEDYLMPIEKIKIQEFQRELDTCRGLPPLPSLSNLKDKSMEELEAIREEGEEIIEQRKEIIENNPVLMLICHKKHFKSLLDYFC